MKQLSDLATEREIHEFFSFSGEIEHIQIVRWVISILKFNLFLYFDIPLLFVICNFWFFVLEGKFGGGL